MKIKTKDFYENFAKSASGFITANLMDELQKNLFIGECKNSLYYEWTPSEGFVHSILGEGTPARRYVAMTGKDSNTADKVSIGIFGLLTQSVKDSTEEILDAFKFCIYAIAGRIVTGNSVEESINWFMHHSITECIVDGAINTEIIDVSELQPNSIFLAGEIIPLYGIPKSSSRNGSPFEEEKGLTYEDLKSKYGDLFKDREFSDEERKMLKANADSVGEYYEPSPNVIELVKKVTKSFKRPAHLRKTNILLEGGTGTGKTKDSQVFADIIGLPYTKITCFSDMDSSDVTGGIFPVFDSQAPKLSDLAIEIDPEGCYMQLTGVQKADATPDEIRQILRDKKPTAPEYTYYASEIVKAFENGWVLEIQEPTCISDAAVLMILNSALEKDGVINLPDRTVRRHPDFICIMTTNRNYNGCRPLNEALRNRFDITRKVELPEDEVMIARLKKATGCEDDKLLRTTVEACNKLNKKIYDIGMNSSVSTRNMVAFIADIMDGFPKTDSVLEDFVWNVTTDDEDAAELMTFLEQSTELLF